MGYVLDASISLAWCFGDESTSRTQSLLTRLRTEEAFAPEIWPLEIGNILLSAARKKRITHAKVAEFLALLEGLPIHVDQETSSRAFHEVFALALSEQLTTYGTAYLELAMRLGIPLATNDNALQKAAKRLGIPLM